MIQNAGVSKKKKTTLDLNEWLPNRGGMSWKVLDDVDVSAIGCLNSLVFRNIIHEREKAE